MDKQSTELFDVIVIGAGPAGGQCARQLAKSGVKVLLVEKYATFEENNFSSAGMLAENLSIFDLPQSVVGAYWNRIVIESSTSSYAWKGKEKRGVVLDFAKLRQFLADDCVANGGQILMGHRFVGKVQHNDCVEVILKNNQEQALFFKTKWLIDATGPARKVMFDKNEVQPDFLVASAVEYLIEVPQDVYNQYSDALVFFMGKKWADEGYSWIFPMENKRLKVGSGKLFYEKKKGASSKELTEKIISEHLGLDEYNLIDSHGGVYRISVGLNDVYQKNRVVAIGDAVSTVNPLGGEGIKFAMESADLLVPILLKNLKSGSVDCSKFRRKSRKKYRFSWTICELVCRRVYVTYTDDKLDKRLRDYKEMSSFDDVIDLLFYFKFKRKIVPILYKLMKAKFGVSKHSS